MTRTITRHHCHHCGFSNIAASHDSTGTLRFHRHSMPDTRGGYCEGSGGAVTTDELIAATREYAQAWAAQGRARKECGVA